MALVPRIRLAWLPLLVSIGFGGESGADLPPPLDRTIDFDREVRPIFEISCLRCHGAERPRSDFRLDSRETALRGGYYGPAILPGRGAESPLIQYVAHLEEGMEMPPPGQGERLTPEQVAVLRTWIDQGAAWSASFTPSRQLTVGSSVQWIGVEGNASQFRAQAFENDGWSGGISEFDWIELPDPDTRLQVQGRGWLNQGDYDLRMQLRRRELGFVRLEVETWRKYYDDVGGYYAPYGPAPALSQDLETTHGRAALSLGLTRPRWPQLTLGYEYLWKEGDQSSLGWGVLSPIPFADPGKAIRPGSVAVDETIHRIELDLLYPWEGGLVEDNLWVELYDRSAQAAHPGDGAADLLGTYRESYDHRQVVNTLHAEHQVRPWLMISGGYLFSHLEGDGSVSQSLESLSGGFPPFPGDAAPQVVVEQRSHTMNGNLQFGPWEGLRVYGGLQSEWLDQEGLGDLITPGFPDPSTGSNVSGLNRITLDQTLGLQFDQIPHTVVYGEGRWQQQWTDHRESSLVDDGFDDNRDFTRETDASGLLERYLCGLTVSPWQRISIDASYQWESRFTDYDHPEDRDGSPVDTGNGYPAFIRSRVIEGEEAQTRLAWRAATWLRVGLKYAYSARDYRSDTDSSLLPGFPDSIFYPGGHILAGHEIGHSGTASVSLKPWYRLNLTGSLTYSHTRLVSGVNDGQIVAPYEGQVLSVLSSASFVATQRTDLRVTYVYSHGDYEPQQLTDGLPLGMRYHRHAITPALIHRLSERVTASLRYGYFDYAEPTLGGAHDYRAHWVMAGLTWTLK